MNAFAMFAQQHAELLERRQQPAARPAGARGRPNTTIEDAVLAHVNAHPDVDAQALIAALQVDPDQLYTIMQRLRRNGQIYSTGKVGNGNRWRSSPCQ